jgi:hypothetical protein
LFKAEKSITKVDKNQKMHKNEELKEIFPKFQLNEDKS